MKIWTAPQSRFTNIIICHFFYSSLLQGSPVSNSSISPPLEDYIVEGNYSHHHILNWERIAVFSSPCCHSPLLPARLHAHSDDWHLMPPQADPTCPASGQTGTVGDHPASVLAQPRMNSEHRVSLPLDSQPPRSLFQRKSVLFTTFLYIHPGRVMHLQIFMDIHTHTSFISTKW